MVAHSQIVIGADASALGTTEAARSVPMLRVFGEPDDHLRLTALLATHLRSCSERLSPAQATDLRDAADACLRPSTPWSERQHLVEALLRLARKSGRRHLIGLVDLDGLNPGLLDAESRWNDHDFRRQRRDFMDLVLRAIDEGGWLVLRPNPSRWISQRLALTSAQTRGSAGAPSGVERTLRRIGPEHRPILAWLLCKGALGQDDVEELLEFGRARELQAHVVALAYDILSPQARRAGDLLSALRPPRV